jgi:23S rRNA (uridine2552-2'-O)-methyltransferase
MRLDEARRDLYRRLAKEQGYKSRAAFKLLQANGKYRFIREGDKVIDFGSAPGGWMQVASKAVGPDGLVVGIDLSEVKLKPKNMRFIRMDVNDPRSLDRLLTAAGGKVDVVLSDLAPSVSGIWEIDQARQADMTLHVLRLCAALLKPGGSAFLKLFEGEGAQHVRDQFRRNFATVHTLKPQASRSVSAELYYYCEDWKGGDLPAGPSPP